MDRDLQSIQQTRDLVRAARLAEDQLQKYDKAQIDRIILAIKETGEKNAAYLADLAVTETGMGRYEDKCKKNYFAAHYVYESIKDMPTIGVVSDDQQQGLLEIAEPVGVIAGIVPTTNPTSTVIYKAMIALKARNAIVFSPHPSAAKCTAEAARIVHDAAVAAGAPVGCVSCITVVSMQATNELMKHPDVALILATGGSALVRAAYSSGKPALGVGPGNVPAFVERSADIKQAAADIVTGKCFDNGTICASEQSVVVEECVADELIRHMKTNGAYFVNKEDGRKVTAVVMKPDCSVNPKIVGKDPQFIAKLAGIKVPDSARCIVVELDGVGKEWPLSYEKLSTVLGFYRVSDWHEGCKVCYDLIQIGGVGHSLAIHSKNEAVIREFALKKPIFRMLVNTPSTLGAIGATTAISPAFTLGCGTWGGSSVSVNVTPLHLINIRQVARPIRQAQFPAFPAQGKTGAVEAVTTAVAAQTGTIDKLLLEEVDKRVLSQLK